MTQPSTNGTTANSPASNTAAHSVTGTIGSIAGGYLVARKGWDPLGAAAAIAVVAGIAGRLGSWANARKADGSRNPIVWLLSNWG